MEDPHRVPTKDAAASAIPKRRTPPSPWGSDRDMVGETRDATAGRAHPRRRYMWVRMRVPESRESV